MNGEGPVIFLFSLLVLKKYWKSLFKCQFSFLSLVCLFFLHSHCMIFSLSFLDCSSQHGSLEVSFWKLFFCWINATFLRNLKSRMRKNLKEVFRQIDLFYETRFSERMLNFRNSVSLNSLKWSVQLYACFNTNFVIILYVKCLFTCGLIYSFHNRYILQDLIYCHQNFKKYKSKWS